jgi:hypothetical protein
LIEIRRDPSDQRACDAAASPPEPSASPAICDKAGAADARKRFEPAFAGRRDNLGHFLDESLIIISILGRFEGQCYGEPGG